MLKKMGGIEMRNKFLLQLVLTVFGSYGLIALISLFLVSFS